MNTMKSFSFSVLLGLSINASANPDVQVPDLTAALQQQIEHRMQHLLDTELQANQPASMVVVHGEASRAPKHPAS